MILNVLQTIQVMNLCYFQIKPVPRYHLLVHLPAAILNSNGILNFLSLPTSSIARQVVVGTAVTAVSCPCPSPPCRLSEFMLTSHEVYHHLEIILPAFVAEATAVTWAHLKHVEIAYLC